MESTKRAGGQAVIEGVMMRSGSRMAIAVRTPDGKICVHREPAPLIAERHRVLTWPIIRGAVALVESLSLGIRALMFSANAQATSEEEELTGKEMVGAIVSAVAVAILLFVVVPTLLTSLLRAAVLEGIFLNLIEGLIRLTVVVGYIFAIQYFPDMGRVLAYHGAEHMVIHSWEQSGSRSESPVVTLEEVRDQRTAHPRCGTSFLLMVALVSILVFSFFGWPSVLGRIGLRLALLPLVAGISYELIMLGSRTRNPLFNLLLLPGLWLQRLTTRDPDDEQLEVAIAALEGCLVEREKEHQLSEQL